MEHCEIIKRIKEYEELIHNSDDPTLRKSFASSIRKLKWELAEPCIKKRCFDLNDNDILYVRLNKNSKTLSMIDGFYNSTKLYLILDRLFYVNYHGLKSISLVVVRRYELKYPYDENGLTISQLKRVAGSIIREKALPYMKKDDEKRSLYNEILRSLQNNTSDKPILFDKGHILEAQTYDNRSGYGRTYRGYELIDEGTYYGETTEFIIIGMIINI